MSVEEMIQRAEELAVEIVREHIEALKQVWAEQHAQRKENSVAAHQARHKRYDAENKIQKLEAELNSIYADLALKFAEREELTK